MDLQQFQARLFKPGIYQSDESYSDYKQGDVLGLSKGS